MLMVSVKLYGLALTCCIVVQANNLQMIVRAHECVMDGFERFAQGHLITLFSATNYCGTANNAGGSFVSSTVGVSCHPLWVFDLHAVMSLLVWC